MQVALSYQEYIRYFGSDSPLEIYSAYWKFDGGWESLWSYVLERAGDSLGSPHNTPEDLENEQQVIDEVAERLRLDAAGEAVMGAKFQAGVVYGPAKGGTVVYDEILDGYCVREASGREQWFWSEKIADMQEVARALALIWWESEG